MNKNKHIIVRTTPEFKKKLKVLAAKTNRTITEIVHDALLFYLNPARQDPRFSDDCDICKFNEEQTSA